MNHEPIDQGIDSKASALESLISSYEMAVLSTLFDQDDSGKVIALARQWGYGQDFLQSVWRELHTPLLNQDSRLEDDSTPKGSKT